MNSSKKALDKSFRAASFDPRKPGSMSTIVSCNDPHYLIARAEEMLREAKIFAAFEKWAKVRDAVAVLGYAMTLLPDELDLDGPASQT